MGFPKKISQLPQAGTLKNSDIFVLVNQHDITSQTTLGDIAAALSGSVDTNTFVTGGTLSGTNLILVRNDNSKASPIDLKDLSDIPNLQQVLDEGSEAVIEEMFQVESTENDIRFISNGLFYVDATNDVEIQSSEAAVNIVAKNDLTLDTNEGNIKIGLIIPPTIGDILAAKDETGNLEWITPSSSTFTGNTSGTPINELWLEGDIHLDNNKNIMWSTNTGTYSNVLFMDGDNKTHIRGVGGGFQIEDGGGIPQFTIDNGIGINSNATFEGNVIISGNTKIQGDLDLCPTGTIYCDSFSGCSPIEMKSEVILKKGIVVDASDINTTIKIPEFICTNCADENDVFHTTQNLQQYVGKTVQFEHTGEVCWNVTKQIGLTVTNSWNTEPNGCEECGGEEGSNNHYVLCEGQEECELTEIITAPENVLIDDGYFNYNCCWYSINPPTSDPTTDVQPTIDDIFPLGVEDCSEAVETFTSFLIEPCVGTLGVDRWITCYEGIKTGDVIKIEEDEIGCYVVVKPATTVADSNFVSVVVGGCVDPSCPSEPEVENQIYNPCSPECADAAGIETPVVSTTKLHQPGSIYFMYKCCWFESIGVDDLEENIDIESPETEIFTNIGVADCDDTELYNALEWEDCNEEGAYRYTACDPNITKTMVTNEMINNEDGEPVEGCWKCVGISNNPIDSQIPEEWEVLECETCDPTPNQLNLKLSHTEGTADWTVSLSSNIGETDIAAFQLSIGDEGILFESGERGEIVPETWEFQVADNNNICFNFGGEVFNINEETIIATWVLNSEEVITSLSTIEITNGDGEVYTVGLTIESNPAPASTTFTFQPGEEDGIVEVYYTSDIELTGVNIQFRPGFTVVSATGEGGEAGSAGFTVNYTSDIPLEEGSEITTSKVALWSFAGGTIGTNEEPTLLLTLSISEDNGGVLVDNPISTIRYTTTTNNLGVDGTINDYAPDSILNVLDVVFIWNEAMSEYFGVKEVGSQYDVEGEPYDNFLVSGPQTGGLELLVGTIYCILEVVEPACSAEEPDPVSNYVTWWDIGEGSVEPWPIA